MAESDQAAQLVQAMAGFGGGAAGISNAVSLEAETSQQTFLTNVPSMLEVDFKYPGMSLPVACLRPPDHFAGIQFASESVSSTKITTKIAPMIMSCPRTNFGRSAALILIIAPPEHIEM